MKRKSIFLCAGVILSGVFFPVFLLSLGFARSSNPIMLSLAILNVTHDEAIQLDQEVHKAIQQPSMPHRRPLMQLRHRPTNIDGISPSANPSPGPASLPAEEKLEEKQKTQHNISTTSSGTKVENRRHQPRTPPPAGEVVPEAVPHTHDFSKSLLEDADQLLKQQRQENQRENVKANRPIGSGNQIQGKSPSEEDRLYANPDSRSDIKSKVKGHNQEQEYRHMKRRPQTIKARTVQPFEKFPPPGLGGGPRPPKP